jgi:succinoglycan biosynthesis protein ExoV
VILYRWRGASTNFGDELNTILWPRLLPGFFDGDPAIRFLGIGSVLDRRHSAQATKLVAGSGYGGYEARPILDETWIIHWVRGRRTAATLGLPARLALGDPASLLPGAIDLPAADGQDIGFMPHFESAAWGAWGRVTELAGVRLIDPRDHPLAILQAILRCRRLLSQALHGVIAADALRVPWIAIQPLAASHRPKWWDWADTMELRPRFRGLPASTPLEWARTSRLNGVHAIRTWLDRQEPHLAAMTSERLVTRAAGALRRAMLADPQQSSDATLDRCRSRMLDAVEAIRSQTLHAPAYPAISVPLRSRLQPRDDSAYQLTPIG